MLKRPLSANEHRHNILGKFAHTQTQTHTHMYIQMSIDAMPNDELYQHHTIFDVCLSKKSPLYDAAKWSWGEWKCYYALSGVDASDDEVSSFLVHQDLHEPSTHYICGCGCAAKIA